MERRAKNLALEFLNAVFCVIVSAPQTVVPHTDGLHVRIKKKYGKTT